MCLRLTAYVLSYVWGNSSYGTFALKCFLLTQKECLIMRLVGYAD